MVAKITKVAEAAAQGINEWLTLAPETARMKFRAREAKSTPENTAEVSGKKELFKYIENYPGTPAVLAIYKNPALLKYYFPKLKIKGDSLKVAQDMVKMQVYADILKKTKDISLLDRIEKSVEQDVNVHIKKVMADDGD